MCLLYLYTRLVLLPWLILVLECIIWVKEWVRFFFRMIVSEPYPMVVRPAIHRFEDLKSLGYNYQENYVELPAGLGVKLPRVHYVDEGPKDATEVVLCLHGQPSWSFLYRKVINGLVKQGYRVVAPDFIGFGKSDKYTHPDAYSHSLHKLTIRLLIDHLKLKNVTLVGHGWGGLVGLNIIQEAPDHFEGVVMMNTGLPIGEHTTLTQLHTVTPFLAWRALVRLFGVNLPVGLVFKYCFSSNVTKQVLAAYSAPFPSSEHLGGLSKWPRLLPLTTGSVLAGEMETTKQFFGKSWGKPSLILFSNDDSITCNELDKLIHLFPHAKRAVIDGGHHFLQEEKGEEVKDVILRFLTKQL